ncbi:MAG: response regulator transcription factor [Clostridiales Family XIII bacterium]|jgi:two-component system response regulator VicR|nr:response regulator transcription factor [Clostridiales Family XIII bacterium]
MNDKKILIIEDERSIADIIKINLQKDGFAVEISHDGQEGLNMALNNEPDLVLLDVMLPSMDGFDVCRKIREKSSVPIIMLTAKEEEVDKVLGLELGADDYITKPFGMRELIARIKANLRRGDYSKTAVEPEGDKIYDFGSIVIDLKRYEVRKGGEVIDLTLREFELFRYLAEKKEKVFSREQLLQDVWGYEYFGDIRTVDVTVRRLREKIETDSSNPKYIVTKRGVGYYFESK